MATSTERLFQACHDGDAAAAQAALDAGAQVDARSADGTTPLACACTKGAAAMAQLLLRAGADVDLGSSSGYTPLMGAAASDFIDTVDVLLKAGTETDAVTLRGTNALHIACQEGSAGAVRSLLQAGMDADKPDSGVVAYTPLHYACNACDCGSAATVQVLLEAGVDVDALSEISGRPLHIAINRGNAAIVELLVQAGARVDADVDADTVFTTALHEACMRGNAAIVKILLDAGADAGADDNEGREPLECAAECDDAEAVTLLVKAGASTNRLEPTVGLVEDFVRCMLDKDAQLAAQKTRLAAQQAELEQLRSIQPGVQQLIIGAAGMLKRLEAERMPRHD